MTDDSALGAVAFAVAPSYALMLAAPGPNLFLVLEACLGGSRRCGLAAVLGIAFGAAGAALVAFGGATLLSRAAHASLFGALLLACLLTRAAIKVALGRPLPAAAGALARSRGVRFATGFITAMLNPLTASFFLGVFAAHPALLSPGAALGVAALAFVLAGSWFSALALLFSCGHAGALAGLARGRWRYGLSAALVLCALWVLARASDAA